MFIMTMTKKKIQRIALIASCLLIASSIGVFAILSAINTKAESGKVPIYCVDRGDNKIAITFDVAWENSNTDELIEILEKENVKATFFVTGDWCDRYPEDVLKFYEAGHEIQNHSDQHPHISGMNTNDLISDAKACNKKIEMITKQKPTLYRAPYGEYDDNSLTTLEGMGFKVIQWDVDSIDWKDIPADEIKTRVINNTESGSILLFHNDLANTTEALTDIITTLKKKGYEFVPVSDLIFYESYHMDHTGKQICDVQTDTDALNAFISGAEQAAEAVNIDDIVNAASEKLSDTEISEAMQYIEQGDYESAAEMLPDDIVEALNGLDDEQISEIIMNGK